MRLSISLMATAILLTACAQQSNNYAQISAGQNQQMAEDSVRQIAALYPAASTHIFLSQAPNDAYGKALEKKLRESGYAVQQSEGLDNWLATLSPPDSPAPSILKEKLPSPEATHQAVPVLPVSTGKIPVAETTNLPVSYIVDRLDKGLYRVSIMLDTRVLSRVYILSKKRFGAAGAWALRG